MRLDKSSPIPLYYQLKEALAKLIESGYAPGDMLPSEPEIEKKFEVSRMTVRLAMNALVEEGLVVKQQGRGTFVQAPKITHRLSSVTSWTQQMLERGMTPKTIQTELDRIEPPKKIKLLLGLEESEPILRIRRIRHANSEPMCVMVNYVRERYVPGLMDNGMTEESFYSLLEKKYRLRIAKAQETVEAREATEEEADKLKVELWSPVLFVTRVSFLPDGSPLEVVHLTSRADRYQYQIMLYSN